MRHEGQASRNAHDFHWISRDCPQSDPPHTRLHSRDVARRTSLLFLICSGLLLGTVLSYTQWVSRRAVADAVRGELQQVAAALASEAEVLLTEDLRKIPLLARAPRVREFVAEKNRGYEAQSPSAIAPSLRWKNDEFLAAPGRSSIVLEILENPLSVWLRKWREERKGRSVEVFVTDRHGAVVAATSRPAAFYRGDEGWWQRAYHRRPGGRGGYAGEAAPPDIAGADAIATVSPILDEADRVIGVIRADVSLAGLFRRIGQVRMGGTGRAYLLTADGASVIAGPSGWTDPGESPTGLSFLAARRDREGLLSAVAPVPMSRELGLGLFGGGWVVYVEKDLREVVSHLRGDYLRGVGVGALAVLILGVHFYGAVRLMLDRRLERVALRAVWRYVILAAVLFLLAWLAFGPGPRRQVSVEELFEAQRRVYQPRDLERRLAR
ncbi:MAG: cache domain-containing protein [Candidatus Tectomicrobia bacterium]|nr:cache domain-containing protein [Candidatus Tectomicrobia bacterium]